MTRFPLWSIPSRLQPVEVQNRHFIRVSIFHGRGSIARWRHTELLISFYCVSSHVPSCRAIFNAGIIPNIKENPRNRKHPKRGRKRFFNAAIHALRMRVERTFAWEDKFKRLLLRFERIQQRHYGMKLLAYTMINLRAFCGV